METIKSALGYGTTQEQEPQAGSEPVSGQTGTGTAGEPYDAGNVQQDRALGGSAPQHTSSTTGGVLSGSNPEHTSSTSGSGFGGGQGTGYSSSEHNTGSIPGTTSNAVSAGNSSGPTSSGNTSTRDNVAGAASGLSGHHGSHSAEHSTGGSGLSGHHGSHSAEHGTSGSSSGIGGGSQNTSGGSAITGPKDVIDHYRHHATDGSEIPQGQLPGDLGEYDPRRGKHPSTQTAPPGTTGSKGTSKTTSQSDTDNTANTADKPTGNTISSDHSRSERDAGAVEGTGSTREQASSDPNIGDVVPGHTSGQGGVDSQQPSTHSGVRYGDSSDVPGEHHLTSGSTGSTGTGIGTGTGTGSSGTGAFGVGHDHKSARDMGAPTNEFPPNEFKHRSARETADMATSQPLSNDRT